MIYQIIYFAFLFLGIFGLIIDIVKFDLVYTLASISLILISIALLYFQIYFIEFNKHKKNVYKKNKFSFKNRHNECIPFKHIKALQIIRKFTISTLGGHTSYELNIILTDNNRSYIMDYTNYQIVKNYGETISNFLDVPLLEQTNTFLKEPAVVYSAIDNSIAEELISLLARKKIDAYSTIDIENTLGIISGKRIQVFIKDKNNYNQALQIIDQYFDNKPNQPSWKCPECNEEHEGVFTSCWSCGYQL